MTMAHAHFTYGYKHTLRICNNYCFPTIKMVARTSLNVTLYVHCLSCLLNDDVNMLGYETSRLVSEILLVL